MVATPDLGPIVIKNVQVFDGVNSKVIPNATVVVDYYTSPDLPKSIFTGNQIKGFPVGYFVKTVTTDQLSPSELGNARIIDGGGNILMPGLIDTHYHLAWANKAYLQGVIASIQNTDPSFSDTVAAMTASGVKEASNVLLRGFTSVREVGGVGAEIKAVTEYTGNKKAAGFENLPTPRDWSAEAMISATAGHSDFAEDLDQLNTQDGNTHQELLLQQLDSVGFRVADGVDQMLLATREQFKKGADLIKISIGGGVSSAYDPIDTTTITAAEIRAIVEVAKGFGTYVTAHAYTPESINLGIDNGVKMFEHANLIDDATMKKVAKLDHDADPTNDVWINISPFFANAYANPKQGEAAIKKALTETGTAKAYAYAKKYDLLGYVGFGTDVIASAGGGDKAPKMLGELASDINKAIANEKSINPEFAKEINGIDTTYTNFDTLKMATSVNGRMLGESGLRTAYYDKTGHALPGSDLGVIKSGAVADLILAKYDPNSSVGAFDQLANDLSNVDKNFLMVMKDGVVYKNTLAPIQISEAYNSAKVSSAEFVSTAYQHILGRLPEGAALSAWVGALNSPSYNRDDFLKTIYSSTEFNAKKLTNSAFVTELFNDLLNRQADAGGQKYWTDALDHGLARVDLVGSIVNSTEFLHNNDTLVCDQRLKKNIRFLEKTACGVRLYEFSYHCDDKTFVGPMAQELLENYNHSHAVEINNYGIYQVNLKALGLGYLASYAMSAAGRNAIAAKVYN